ncbi:MAG: SRPBCC domain-containing protein [Proteobacteria bacterium]|nr:SRPBCC domain-containing protein [Pseudomonadota bacterium]
MRNLCFLLGWFLPLLTGCAAEFESADPVDVEGADSALTATVDEPRPPGPHSVVFRQSAVIDADVATIWNLLVDLNGYQDWNPWVVWAEGEAFPGAQVFVDVVMGKKTMRAEHTVLAVDPEQRFCWKDAGWNAKFVYGQRCRWLTVKDDGRVLFEQELLLDGALAGVSALFYGHALRDGMAAETVALKDYAEDLQTR